MYLPKPIKHGGSLVGNSYLSLYAKCPRKWFYSFYYPQHQPTDPLMWNGLAPIHTPEALIMGSVFHEGLAAMYLSGCRDGEDTGEWSLEQAIEAAQVHYNARKKEYLDQDKAEADWLSSKQMLVGYFNERGPGGPQRDWPETKVLFDDQGEPFVEREFTLPLAGGRYVYTARLDLIVERLGNVMVMEHKSSTASGVWSRLAQSSLDSQMTGEILVASEAFPEHNLNGVLVNVVTKNLSAKSKVGLVNRTTVDRTPEQLTRFKIKVINILVKIDESIKAWNEAIDEGMDRALATDAFFPDYGENNGQCFSYMRECEYAGFCKQLQPEHVTLRNFRPKTQEEVVTWKEFGG